jgi:hypothetical protein
VLNPNNRDACGSGLSHSRLDVFDYFTAFVGALYDTVLNVND